MHKALKDTAQFMRTWLRDNKPGRRYMKTPYGVLLRANHSDWVFKFALEARDGYTYSRFLSSIDTPFTFLDIGANQGLYSLVAAKNPQCQGGFAFEPVKKTYSLLRKNIRANGLSSTIKPLNSAVAPSTSGALHIRTFKSDNSGLATLRASSTSDPATSSLQEVSSIGGKEISEMIQENTRIHIKIDVEGFEREVLCGLCEGFILPRTDSVFLEVDEDWVDPQEIIDFMSDKGLASYQKVGTGSHYDLLFTRPGTESLRTIDAS